MLELAFSIHPAKRPDQALHPQHCKISSATRLQFPCNNTRRIDPSSQTSSVEFAEQETIASVTKIEFLNLSVLRRVQFHSSYGQYIVSTSCLTFSYCCFHFHCEWAMGHKKWGKEWMSKPLAIKGILPSITRQKKKKKSQHFYQICALIWCPVGCYLASFCLH